MADLVTIAGVMKPTDATIAYVGDGNNVANSWAFAWTLLPHNFLVVGKAVQLSIFSRSKLLALINYHYPELIPIAKLLNRTPGTVRF